MNKEEILIKDLELERDKAHKEVLAARRSYRSALAYKSELEAKLDKIDEQLLNLKQGQLVFENLRLVNE